MSQNKNTKREGGEEKSGGKKPQKITIAGTSFMSSSFAMMSEFLSPYDAFINYGQAVIALLMLAILGNAFAFFEGGLIVAEIALLIAPSFFLSLLAMATGPFIKPFADAIKNTKNFIMRPIYDIFALLTVGLPYSLAWFWQGKILATGLSLLGHVMANSYFLGAAIAYYATAFTFSGFILTLTSSYATKGVFGGLANVVRSFSLVFSMYAGFIIADIIFFIWMSLPSNIFSFLAPILSFVKLSQFWMTAGALGGFILSLLTVDAFRRIVPNIKKVPITWNIISLLIGATAFMGTDFYIYIIIALTVYMMMLYLISGDGTWLWYTLITVPSAPAIAYYLGYITKLLINYTQSFVVAVILLTALFIVMLVIFAVIVVIIAIPAIMASTSSGPLGTVAGIVTLSVAIAGAIIGIAGFISTMISYIQSVVFLSDAYRILIAPA